MMAGRRRRICIRLSPRERRDNPEIIYKIRRSLEQAGLSLVVLSGEHENSLVVDERLQSKAIDLAAAVLDRAASIARNTVPPHGIDKDNATESKALAHAGWKRMRAWLGGLVREGWKIAIGKALDKVIPPKT